MLLYTTLLNALKVVKPIEHKMAKIEQSCTEVIATLLV